MKIVETEYKCETCCKSIILSTTFIETTPPLPEIDMRAYAAEKTAKSHELKAFIKKHSEHILRQYTELEAIG